MSSIFKQIMAITRNIIYSSQFLLARILITVKLGILHRNHYCKAMKMNKILINYYHWRLLALPIHQWYLWPQQIWFPVKYKLFKTKIYSLCIIHFFILTSFSFCSGNYTAFRTSTINHRTTRSTKKTRTTWSITKLRRTTTATGKWKMASNATSK